MPDKLTEFKEHLLLNGDSVTYTALTGTNCPCRLYNDGTNASYSTEWHDNNSGEDACNGTLLIDTSTANTTLKAVITLDIDRVLEYLKSSLKTEIGQKGNRFVALLGCLDSTDNSLFDFSAVNKKGDYFTFNSKTFKLYDYEQTKEFFNVGILIEYE